MPSSVPSTRLETCRAAVFVGPRHPLELRRFPLPEPGPGEALVRIECCTICGSDLHTFRGARTEPVPSILGHEALGIVERVGAPPPYDLDQAPVRAGDRITWSVAVSCGDCDRCRRGLPQKCRTLFKYGHSRADGPYALSGGLSEFLLLRSRTAIVRIPPDLPAETICPVNCAAATVAAAFRTAGPVDGRRVLIVGAGMLGQTAAAFAHANGAAEVVVCDPDADRLSRAARFGASRGVESHPDRNELRRRLSANRGSAEFDVLFELSGASSAVAAAIDFGDVGARIVLVGSVMPSPEVAVDPESIVRRWLSIAGVHNYAPVDLQTAVAFLQRTAAVYPFAELVDRTFTLETVNEALEWAEHARPFRVAVRP